jgi:hypothetical protein
MKRESHRLTEKYEYLQNKTEKQTSRDMMSTCTSILE